MTNATVAEVAEGAKGRLLTLKYKDGEKELEVPMEAPIVTVREKGGVILSPRPERRFWWWCECERYACNRLRPPTF